MSFAVRQLKRRRGVTLIEIIVAMVVIVIAVMGAMGYRYYSILDARKAKVKMTAARVGSMLLENWKGTGGHSEAGDEYDPELLGYGSRLILEHTSTSTAGAPSGFSSFGTYRIAADGSNYLAILSYSDDTATNLRTLNIALAWPQKYPSGTFTSEDLWTYTQSVRFTSKVLIPEGG
jgi:prepilin-type N-terminal cleavage/methylation domain-containing protein